MEVPSPASERCVQCPTCPPESGTAVGAEFFDILLLLLNFCWLLTAFCTVSSLFSPFLNLQQAPAEEQQMQIQQPLESAHTPQEIYAVFPSMVSLCFARFLKCWRYYLHHSTFCCFFSTNTEYQPMGLVLPCWFNQLLWPTWWFWCYI